MANDHASYNITVLNLFLFHVVNKYYKFSTSSFISNFVTKWANGTMVIIISTIVMIIVIVIKLHSKCNISLRHTDSSEIFEEKEKIIKIEKNPMYSLVSCMRWYVFSTLVYVCTCLSVSSFVCTRVAYVCACLSLSLCVCLCVCTYTFTFRCIRVQMVNRSMIIVF